MKSLNRYQIQGGIALFWMKVHNWMNKFTFIYNLDEGGSYTPVKIAFCTT
jgi:hypothetical protein